LRAQFHEGAAGGARPGVVAGPRAVSGMESSPRADARAWVRRYVRAAGELGSRGLAACFPIGREQLCAEDPDNAVRLGAAPDFILVVASDGKSVVLRWTEDGTSELCPLPSLDERAGREETAPTAAEATRDRETRGLPRDRVQLVRPGTAPGIAVEPA